MSNKILKLPEVMGATGLSRSSIYSFINQNTFPEAVPLGKRAVGWLQSEVDQWISQRAQSRGTLGNSFK